MSRYAAVHREPHGPGDARPTALDIVRDEGLTGKLAGKVFLVTGCNAQPEGIGIHTAKALLATGATVYITTRTQEQASAAEKQLSSGNVHSLLLDLSSQQSVRACAKEFLAKTAELHGLVMSAGVMAPPSGKTAEGYDLQLGVNYLGHLLLFQLLKPALLKASSPTLASRVIVLTSSQHRNSPILFEDINFDKEGSFDTWKAYSQSKTANIYLATEIERRYGSQGVHAWAVHPGGIISGLVRHLDMNLVGAMTTPKMKEQIKNPEQGASSSVWAALAVELEGKGGKYLEDCGISQPFGQNGTEILDPGYVEHAYDQAAAQRLWDLSQPWIGLSSSA